MTIHCAFERLSHCALLLPFFGISPLFAANPPPTQVFYVPFPEDHQLQGFKAINAVAVEPIAVFVTLAAASDGTVIYYDHWEDGYEKDITNPVQPTTRIFGDGNAANGTPPGNSSDLIPAGTVFNLRNFVTTTSLQSVVDYDARDKIASFKPISVTKMTFPGGTNTLLAGCVEVFERGLWGTEYRSPVGVDMPTTTATATLAPDEDLFNYTALSISAGAGGSTVQIDKDNNGAFEETVVLTEGQSIYRDNVNAGGRVVGSKPLQVVLFTGTLGSTYASRDSSLLPASRWSSEYLCPVSTRTIPADGTVVFLSNPNAAAITVSYSYRSSATAYTTATVSVPAGGNARVTLAPANGTTHFGAYRFYTTGANPPVFSAIGTIDSDGPVGSNVGWDGGFTLVAKPSLTTQVLVSLGIGRDPYSTTNPAENGNPVWITTSGNGNTPANVYVDYNGDNSGALTDPNGNRYDALFTPRELEQLKLYDPDGDQSGMLVYTLDPTVRLAAVWAQDPSVASFAQPGLDVASLVPPMREGDAGKISTLAVDADGDGFVSAGDTLAYDIRTVSNARTTIPGPFRVLDTLPTDTRYVAGSARYRYTVGGSWQAWTAIPDDPTGTPVPLDGPGFPVPGNLPSGQQLQVEFRAVIDSFADLSVATITNTGMVEISPYGLVIPIEWSDELNGSIGDRVWNDLNGNGLQEVGENGIPGIQVFIDTNGNGVFDSGESTSTTAADGKYLLGGLKAGTYQVRISSATVAAVNVGYGPTWDLDGNGSPHAATVTLAGAQDRVDADFGYRVGASVGDRVWMDRNGNRAQDAGEPGVNGVRVYVDINGNGVLNIGEPSAITSGNGDYSIGNLNPGTFTVRVDTSTLPTAATPTHDLTGSLDHAGSVTLTAAEDRADLDFGYRGSLSIGDLVWEDSDASGTVTRLNVYDGRIDLNNSGGVGNDDDGFIGSVRIVDGYVDLNNSNSISSADAGVFQGYNAISGALDINASGNINNSDDATAAISSEAGIANARVYIDSNGNGTYDSASEPAAVTDANGAYTLGNLFNGTYIVRVATGTLPSSYVPTYDLTSPTGDHTATVTLSGSSRTDVDFGYRNDASIGDLVWNDRNANGARDAGEPAISGVLIYIDANANNIFDQATERFTFTDTDGIYRFDNLPAGIYTIAVEFSTLPQGVTATYDLDGTGTVHRAVRTLALSEDATNVDFGYRATASAGDLVWNDTNANGVIDASETGIANVRVYLDINGNGIFENATEPSSSTSATGLWSIGSLVPGIYTARVDTSTLPVDQLQTYDFSGDLDHSATFQLAATQVRSDIDFGYTSRATLGDLVWHDIDGDGRKQGTEIGIAGVEVTAFRAGNDTIAATATTGPAGIYQFLLAPGSYYVVFGTPAGFAATLANQGTDTGDSDAVNGRSHTVTLIGGQSNLTVDAGFYQPAAISGSVRADINNDNTGDVGIGNVTLTLQTSAGIDIDSDPLTPGVQPTVTVTDAGGSYIFALLPPGSYRVVETQPSGYLSVLDTDGLNNDIIGDQTPLLVTSGQTSAGHDFIEEQPGSIEGTVFRDADNNGSGDAPLSGVILTLLDRTGNPVDGDPNTAGVQPITTVTDSNGHYTFTGVVPGDYQVAQSQPFGYNSSGDSDGGDLNIVGDGTLITVRSGQVNANNDFIETLDTCPDTWAEWLFQHPSQLASGNPDADRHDNLAEFAFAMPAENGSGSPWLGKTAWIVQPSTLAPGTIEGVFIRPQGAVQNVTYHLEYVDSLVSPILWQWREIEPALVSIVNNGDCTETVTIHDLEGLTGMAAGEGFVRIRADLDEENDGEIDHTTDTEVEGWKETTLGICCRTYSNPFLRETVFTGTASTVTGQTLDLTGSGAGLDFATLLAGGPHYLEVTSGDNEGHRFDVVSGMTDSVTLASDVNLFENVVPYNSFTGALPANLAGDTVVLRRHWTLGEMFTPAGLVASADRSTADQVQLFANGQWTIYWLYNDGVLPPRWVKTGDNTYADQGAAIIAPGQGLFFNKRQAAAALLAYGEVRENDFIRPLAVGSNLVAGGYPLDQSATGRAMSIAAGFFGSRDIATADSFYVWKGDATAGDSTYDTYFLNNNAPRPPSIIKWARVGDASLLARDAETLLPGNGSVFIRSKNGLPSYTLPSPWNP